MVVDSSPFAQLALRFRGARHILPVLTVTIVLFMVSSIVAPGSVQSGSLLTMAPYAAVLAVVALGQALVIQQGGLDLSVPGTVSLATVLLTVVPKSDPSLLALAILITLAGCALIGLINGLAVTRLQIPPLVGTLAVNSISLGFVQFISHGIGRAATPDLRDFFVGKSFGIPHAVLFAFGIAVLVGLMLSRTTLGRQLLLVGTNDRAARVVGPRVAALRLGAYIGASVLYGLAAIMLTGYVGTPSVYIGSSYLLASIAAVVVGGASLAGGFSSAAATALGALFLSQLNQLVLSIGLNEAIQLIVQAVVIAVGTILGSRMFIFRAGSRSLWPEWKGSALSKKITQREESREK